jgi:glycosyltransferase involved in cell wall biosynthesis
VKILHTIRGANPASGGPIEAVRQFSRAMAAQGHHIEIASLDHPGDSWVKESEFTLHALGTRPPTHYGRSPAFTRWLREHHGEFDAVIVNGLWQFASHGTRLALRGAATPYFVFPHGMLDPWFKRQYPLKHLKKWLYWPWAEYRVLGDARAVLFTCEEEKILARQSFWLYRANEEVANLGIAEPSGDAAAQRALVLGRFPELRDRRVVLFLGRIHEKKGCDLLLEAFAAAAKREPRLHLLMAGPDQAGLQARLQQRAASLDVAARVTWAGMLSGDLKWGAFHVAEVFALPSHQENFGLAVVEALACGVPVLIAHPVNIWREIEDDGAGFADKDDLAGTQRALDRWLALPDSERRAMRERARGSFCRRFEISQAAANLIAVLRACGVKDG